MPVEQWVSSSWLMQHCSWLIRQSFDEEIVGRESQFRFSTAHSYPLVQHSSMDSCAVTCPTRAVSSAASSLVLRRRGESITLQTGRTRRGSERKQHAHPQLNERSPAVRLLLESGAFLARDAAEGFGAARLASLAEADSLSQPSSRDAWGRAEGEVCGAAEASRVRPGAWTRVKRI